MIKKTIFIPIEIKTRDYFPRLTIASELLKKNYNIIFGRKRELEKLTLFYSNSIYLGLQSSRTYLEFYRKLKKKNFKIAIIDEEGLSTLNKRFYLEARASNELFKLIDKFLCWGNFQYKQIFHHIKKEYRQKLVCTGNPRIDLLKTKFSKLYTLKKTKLYKNNYILINLAFGQVNHFQHRKSYFEYSLKNKIIKSKFEVENYKKFLRFKQKRFNLYKKLIFHLATSFPHQLFIVRPHPSESEKTYNFLSKFKNIIIDKKNNHIAIIKGSKLVITDFCTTALESILLNKNTYVYKRPRKNVFLDESFYNLTKNISSDKKLSNIIESKKKFSHKKNYNLRIKNLKKFSYFEISDLINTLKLDIKSDSLIKSNIFKNILIKIYMSLFFLFKKDLYSIEKCENLDFLKIKNDFKKINNLLNNKKKYVIKNLCNSVFKIS